MSQPFTNGLPYYDGKNWAPVKPFTVLRERNGHTSPFAKHYVADAIKAKYEEKIKMNESSWREMISVGQLVALFIEGKQILDWNPYTNAWVPRKLSRTDPNKIKAVNMMQYYSTNWQSKWGSSNPDIILGPHSNRDQDISRARKANAVVDHLEKDMYDSWYNYHEGMMAQTFGWYGSRVRLCFKTGSRIAVPQMVDQEVTIGQGWGKCHDCGHSGSAFNSVQISQTDSMPVCPKCGSTGVVYEPPVTQIMQQQQGMTEQTIPRVISEQLPFPACRWDIRFRCEQSPWMIFEQDVDPNAIRRVLGDIRFPEGDSPNTIGLDAVASLGIAGAPLSGRSDVEQKKRQGNVLTEFYLSADDLYDIKVQGDEQTVEGDMLPTGARLSELFPEGACFLGLNGMNLITGIFAEKHSDTVTSGVWHMKPLSGTGRGAADAVEIQKRFNRFDSQAVRWMQVRATPATLHAEGAIPPNKKHLLGQPDVDIPIQLQNFPDVRSVRDLIAPLQGESIPGDMLQYTYQHLSNFMQLAYHITDFSNGLNPRVRNDTATGAEILDANADSLFHPALDIKAEVRVETAKKAFKLWCRVNPHKQFIALKSKARSGARGLDVSAADVEGDYSWSYVPGSQLPKNKLTKRRDMVNFYAQFGGFMGYLQAKAAAPAEVAEAERAFDMDFATNDFDELGEICRTRLEYAKDLLDQAAQLTAQLTEMFGGEVMLPPPNPMLILPEVKPTMLVTESDHPAKASWFSRLLDTTEGQEMTDLERNLVSAFVQGHMMLAQGQELALATAATETAVQANAPADAAEAEKAAAESDQQQQQELQKGQVAHAQNMELTEVKEKRAAQREKIKQQRAEAA